MALSRYSDFKIILDKLSNKNRLESFPNVNSDELKDSSDVFIRFQDGQRIDTLAHQYLGDGRYWWIICLMNDIKYPLGNELLPGSILRITTNVSKVLNTIKSKINSI